MRRTPPGNQPDDQLFRVASDFFTYISIDTSVWRRAEALELPGRLRLPLG
jgi:hypothetical protein